MSERKDDAGFDWTSPRWRDGDDSQSAKEHSRRLWDRQPPGQRGAIDADGSVPGPGEEGPSQQDDASTRPPS